MTVIINGTTGVTFPNGVTMSDGTSAPVTVAQGGTGANTASAARTSLGTNDAANITTGVVAIANGGTGANTATAAFNALNPMTTTGDILYEASPTVAARLGIGSSGQVLTVAGGLPSWAALPAGGVTSFNGNTGAIEGMQRVASGSFSSATTINMTGLPTGYQAFKVIITTQGGSSGSSSNYGFRVSNNNGSSYLTSNYQTTGLETNQSGSIGGFYANTSRTACEVCTGNITIFSNTTFSTEFILWQKPDTANTSTINMSYLTAISGGTNTMSYVQGVGQVFGDTSYYVNALSFVRTNGTASITGTYTVYGIRA
jgi:hypothetical protein